MNAFDTYGNIDPEYVNSLLMTISGYGVPQGTARHPLEQFSGSVDGPSQMNFMKNNSTGATYKFDQLPVQLAQGPAPNYSQPIEIAGVGKGYRDKNDSGKVMLDDGRTFIINADNAATVAKQKERAAAEKMLLENELLRAKIAGAGAPKAPAGQRFTEDGRLEWIPGSAGEIKSQAAAAKASESLATHNAGTDALIRNIDQLIGNPEQGIAEHRGLRGSVGYLDAKLPPMNKDQATAQALINSLLSKSAISGLQQIRQSGTAPGSITEKEWPLFQNLIATLDPTQDEATFTEQLKELRRVAAESKARAQTSYENTYGQPSVQQPQNIPAAQPSQYVEIRTAPNGQRIGKKADGSYEVVK